jgi:hypothetical protein
MKCFVKRAWLVVFVTSGLCACSDRGGYKASHSPPPQAGTIAHDGPDLVFDANATASTVEITRQDFLPSDCEVIEGCVAKAGNRRLLHFATTTINKGTRALVLGDPANSPLFTYNACHGHYHFTSYVLMELVNRSSNAVAVAARKEGFCLNDDALVSGNAPAVYDCSNQGLSVGWSDTYDVGIDCQWLDITDVQPGEYILRQTVNPDHLIQESDYSNNVMTVPVTIPAEPAAATGGSS